jgi:hypothetical protein
MTDRRDSAPPDISRNTRRLGQRFAFGFALGFYAGALACALALGIWVKLLGAQHPVIASLAASIVFFVGSGIVLYVIGRVDLPELRPGA